MQKQDLEKFSAGKRVKALRVQDPNGEKRINKMDSDNSELSDLEDGGDMRMEDE